MPALLTRIDQLTRPDHTFLEPDDVCYYLGEYTARRGYSFSRTNDLINNLKKPVNRRGLPEWRYKEAAIARCAAALRQALNPAWLATTTLVPMPPSKRRDHPEYDDRVFRIVQGIGPGDVRELVVMRVDLEAAHLHGAPRGVQELRDSMALAEALLEPAPGRIALIDDVLTTGAHFKAAKSLLQAHFPAAPVVGIFIARRAPNSE